MDLPVDFFPEYRRDFVVARIDSDARLLEDTYTWIRRRERPPSR